MEPFIFRSMVANLSTNEQKILFSKLIDNKAFDINFIYRAIFNEMYKNMYNRNNNNKIVKQINDIIKSIVATREPLKPNKITFNSLSSSMINHIGSFLSLMDIINFEQTSNRCLIALRSPYPALKKLGYTRKESHLFNKYMIDGSKNNFIQFSCLEAFNFIPSL